MIEPFLFENVFFMNYSFPFKIQTSLPFQFLNKKGIIQKASKKTNF